MKVWLLVSTAIFGLSSPDEKIDRPYLQENSSIDGGACLKYNCLSLLPDKPLYKNKEECEKEARSYATKPTRSPNGKVGTFAYKCIELEINWIEQQQPQKKCPPELQEGYRSSLQLMKDPAMVQFISEAIQRIVTVQKTLGCQFD